MTPAASFAYVPRALAETGQVRDRVGKLAGIARRDQQPRACWRQDLRRALHGSRYHRQTDRHRFNKRHRRRPSP